MGHLSSVFIVRPMAPTKSLAIRLVGKGKTWRTEVRVTLTFLHWKLSCAICESNENFNISQQIDLQVD